MFGGRGVDVDGKTFAQSADELLTLGREAFMNYEFDKARPTIRASEKESAKAGRRFHRQVRHLQPPAYRSPQLP